MKFDDIAKAKELHEQIDRWSVICGEEGVHRGKSVPHGRSKPEQYFNVSALSRGDGQTTLLLNKIPGLPEKLNRIIDDHFHTELGKLGIETPYFINYRRKTREARDKHEAEKAASGAGHFDEMDLGL